MKLDRYQELFNIDDTTERCRKVLDHIEPHMQELFSRLKEEFEQNRDVNDVYEIKSYGVTLRTTYHDSQNPKYAESKKDTNIGRKYFIKLQKKVYEDEVNVLTLEFNGIDHSYRMYVETAFYPLWAALQSKKLDQLIIQLPKSIHTYVKQPNNGKTEIPKDELSKTVQSYVKPAKRPPFYFGIDRPLTGELTEEVLMEELKDLFDQLSPIYRFIDEERSVSFQTNNIFSLLMKENESKEVSLLGHAYKIEYGEMERNKNEGHKQSFYLYDQEQLVVKGIMSFHAFSDKYNTVYPHRLAVIIDGHNHMWAKIRDLVGDGKTTWWIHKTFATHTLNNQQILKKAFQHLNELGIETSDSRYSPGTYDNDRERFEEEADLVKSRLAMAALIFAHVSEKLVLPEGEKEGTLTEGEDEEGEQSTQLESNFDFSAIIEHVKTSKLTFQTSVIRDFHLNLTALEDKHFVILSGISGTGKTQLAKLYANAVFDLSIEETNPYLTIIPVRPDWMDATALFGYYSSFDKRYVMPEFLRMILKARQERDKPHFILLDEMNLARVEYYLSDYLSAVESQKSIPLHDRNDVVDVPQTITIPPNVYIVGTINVDETTHSISDKVLDRAFVMTLSDVNFDPYWQSVSQTTREKLQGEFSLLKEIHHVLLPYDLHFGYRSMNEMVRKLMRNMELDFDYQMGREEALDVVIREKVLPKIKGDERIAPLFQELIDLIRKKLGNEAGSLVDLTRMQKELDRYGATQYWR
ncbi:McrB family protein [Salipaludibacillus daqingensis]|uniref:McrB family protein n=1 Tax=Salipaludibacillus daqingensis TaxID=3041001 RepID=UPI0024738A5D|nr:AAA family ATPase [Salipaludibacillus daqingensis]